MNRTTIFVATTLATARLAFRNPRMAFGQFLFTGSEQLVGFHNKQDAVDAIRPHVLSDVAVLHIIIEHPVHEMLAYAGNLNGAHKHAETGAPVWLVTPAGCAQLAAQAQLLMEIVPAVEQVHQHRFEPAGPLGNGGC
jgi:hypothetical protein